MGYASRAGRARVNPSRPEAFAVCDRCGIWLNHVDLRWQMDYAGTGLINKRILVCKPCLDVPQMQLRTIILPPDPTPIMNARPEQFITPSSDYRTVSDGPQETYLLTGIPVPDDNDFRTTENDDRRVTQQTGFASGSLNEEPGSDPTQPDGGDPGLPYNNDEIPKTGSI
jgi:hypothetical protein